MPFEAIGGALLGGVASAATGSLLGGGGGGGGSYGGSDQRYIPMQQQLMDQNFITNYLSAQNLANTQGSMIPGMAMNTLTGQYYNPQATGYLNAAQNAGGIYGAGSTAAQDAARQNFSTAGQLYQSAFDPRKEIYNQNVKDLTENVRAGEYARGIQSSPYGASVEANTLQRFQNDWQNQQLERQMQGAAAAARAQQAGAGLYNTSAEMGMASGQVPYGAYNNLYGNQNAAVQAYYANLDPLRQAYNQQQNQSANYMGLGQAAQTGAFSQAQGGVQGQAALANQLGGLIGQGVQNIYDKYNQGNSALNSYSTTGNASFGGNTYRDGSINNTYFGGGYDSIYG